MTVSRRIFYACPHCKCTSERMTLLDEQYAPTEAELAERPDMEVIGHETMQCACGKIHTWFSLLEIDLDENVVFVGRGNSG